MRKLHVLTLCLVSVLIASLITHLTTVSYLSANSQPAAYSLHNAKGEYIPVTQDVPYTILDIDGSGVLEEIWSLAFTGPSITDTLITFTVDGTAVSTDIQTLFCLAGINAEGLERTFKTSRLCGEAIFNRNHFGSYFRFPIAFRKHLTIQITPKVAGGTLFWHLLWRELPNNSVCAKFFVNGGGWANRTIVGAYQWLTMAEYSGSGRIFGFWMMNTYEPFVCEGNFNITLDGSLIETPATEDFFLDWWDFASGEYAFDLAVHTFKGVFWGNYLNFIDRTPMTFDSYFKMEWQNGAASDVAVSYLLLIETTE